MKYSKVGFADVDSYSKTLFDLIHPEGLPCPRCNEPNGLHMFRRHLNSWIVDYRCSHCWRIFNPWKATPLDGPYTFRPGVSKPPLCLRGRDRDSKSAICLTSMWPVTLRAFESHVGWRARQKMKPRPPEKNRRNQRPSSFDDSNGGESPAAQME